MENQWSVIHFHSDQEKKYLASIAARNVQARFEVLTST